MSEMQPIGYIQSLFTFKNGTPRQSSICQHARGSLTIEKSVFNNPEHSLEGLESFSHIWIIFVFHKNNNQYTKAKVKPPRLNGKRVGLFSTRCPYRPNPIGLTLAKIDRIEDATVHLSGIDLLDGTPVLDIKPYIQDYDYPKTVVMETTSVSKETVAAIENCHTEIPGTEFVGTQSNTIEESKNIICTKNITSDVEMMGSHGDNVHKNEDMKPSDVIVNRDKFLYGSNKLSHECKKSDSSENNTDSLNQGSNSTDDNRQVSDSKETEIMWEGHSERHDSDNRQFSLVNTNNSSCSKILTSMGKDCSQGVLKSETNSGKGIDNEQPVTVNNSSEITRNKNISCSQDGKKSKISVNRKKENAVNCQTETAGWIMEPPINKLTVRFTETAELHLKNFSLDAEDINYRLRFLNDLVEAKSAISDILREDPRSVYRRKKCEDSLYFFTVDILHVTCWFDTDMAEVVRIKPLTFVEHCNKANS